VADYYTGPHQSQYADDASAITRAAGCTWTSGANGIDDTSGGKRKPKPDAIKARLPKGAETNPGTPGWSLPDLEKATYSYAKAVGMPDLTCVNRTTIGFLKAYGWQGIKKAWAYGRYVVIQGDSDRFGNNSCSGKFDGDHAIGVSPKTRVAADGRRQHWINDGICKEGRWEYDAIIYSYAKKLADRSGTPLRWGCFKRPVPKI
jgi:hypothetical protein